MLFSSISNSIHWCTDGSTEDAIRTLCTIRYWTKARAHRSAAAAFQLTASSRMYLSAKLSSGFLKFHTKDQGRNFPSYVPRWYWFNGLTSTKVIKAIVALLEDFRRNSSTCVLKFDDSHANSGRCGAWSIQSRLTRSNWSTYLRWLWHTSQQCLSTNVNSTETNCSRFWRDFLARRKVHKTSASELVANVEIVP